MDIPYAAVCSYRFPNLEDQLFGRGIDICHETVRFSWNGFGPIFDEAISELSKFAMTLKIRLANKPATALFGVPRAA